MNKRKNYKNNFGLLKYLLIISSLILLITYCRSPKNMEQKKEKIVMENMEENSNLVILQNEKTLLKVLPNIGGRIVAYKNIGGKNILKSDPNLWDHKFEKPTSELILNNKIPFNGHIVWVGPQSEWWVHQNENKKLKSNASPWPPDPYLIYGDFKIIEQREDYIKLQGPKSKYTGVQLTKEIQLLENGNVNFNVEAKNIRKESIAWDLWLNTRMDGFDKVYVPIESEKDLRMQYRDNKSVGKMPYEIENGYFHFNTKLPSNGKDKIDGKAFIYPSTNKIFAFTDSEMFVIEFERYSQNLVHPEQAVIEIFNSVDKKGDGLMELEYHTPYQVIKPSGKISGKENWEIVKYRNENSTKEHIKFINIYLGLTK